MDELIEVLAAAEHTRWAHWQAYLQSKCTLLPTGELVIPLWAVERWSRQMTTPYHSLSVQEQESDREEVRKILPLLLPHLLR